MASIRHYFAVICKAFDSFYKESTGVFESRYSRIFVLLQHSVHYKGPRCRQWHGCHARHTIRCDGVSRIVWKWQGCTQRKFRCRGSSVMIVLAHGVLSSHSNPSKYLCTLTMALEPPLSLALSTKASCASFALTSAR